MLRGEAQAVSFDQPRRSRSYWGISLRRLLRNASTQGQSVPVSGSMSLGFGFILQDYPVILDGADGNPLQMLSSTRAEDGPDKGR